MSKLGQKAAVIQEVLLFLPTFVQGKDNALLALSTADLESIKASIQMRIMGGNIEYSKDITNAAEVRTYARSMVMNHLKKAKELNGGTAYVPTSSGGSKPAKTARTKEKVAPKGVDLSLVPEELKEFVKTLI